MYEPFVSSFVCVCVYFWLMQKNFTSEADSFWVDLLPDEFCCRGNHDDENQCDDNTRHTGQGLQRFLHCILQSANQIKDDWQLWCNTGWKNKQQANQEIISVSTYVILKNHNWWLLAN